jgi:hypothetical protein
MKTWDGFIDPRVIDLGSSWKRVIRFTPVTLSMGVRMGPERLNANGSEWPLCGKDYRQNVLMRGWCIAYLQVHIFPPVQT